MSTASNSSLKQCCSALTSVTSALEVIFNVMRSIGPISTLYLLTYLLESTQLIITDNRFFMKIFRTNNIETVNVCQSFFGISLPSVVLRSRTDKLEQKFGLCADLVKALV